MRTCVLRNLLRPAAVMLSLSVMSLTAQADELMKWERIPLDVPLMVGQERVIFADKKREGGLSACTERQAAGAEHRRCRLP